mgnify:CR=1 FL=1
MKLIDSPEKKLERDISICEALIALMERITKEARDEAIKDDASE